VTWLIGALIVLGYVGAFVAGWSFRGKWDSARASRKA